MEKIEIGLNKNKLKILLLIGFVFVMAGCWFLIDPPQKENQLLKETTVVRGIGLVAILFFGGIAFKIIQKLKDTKPGLVIDKNGITDNSNAVAAGFIPWQDVRDIQSISVFNKEFMMVLVSNPEEYISRQSGTIKRTAMRMNHKRYGSPVSITAETLDCNSAELKKMLLDYFAKVKQTLPW